MTSLTDVTVVIPSFHRAVLLKQTLAGLLTQSYRKFKVLVVLKPSGDGSEDVITSFNSLLPIDLIKQTSGSILDAMNIGLAYKNAGQILLFLDDDTVPFPDLIQTHVEHYDDETVGGVAGDLIINNDGKTCKPSIDKPSVAFKWDFLKPIKGQDFFFCYLSRSGFIRFQPSSNVCVESLLGAGGNMSIRTEAVCNLCFNSESWASGFNYEQVLGWYLWKHGWKLLFDHKAKAYHAQHASLSRLGCREEIIEASKLFWRLKPLEPSISFSCRLQYFIIASIIRYKQALAKGKLPPDMLQRLRWLA